MAQPPPPERKNRGEESARPVKSSMDKFKELAARLVAVKRSEIKESKNGNGDS
jgi:hypothetical protein